MDVGLFTNRGAEMREFYGEVTTYSFIRDPFGGWLEASQRADLAGSLARVEGPLLGQDEIRAIRQSA